MSTRIFVEGGGNGKDLKSDCRKGFRKFLERAGLVGNMPAIFACGGRQNAYKDFNNAPLTGKGYAVLLVDSEDPVTTQNPWHHLKVRDNWDRPDDVTEDQCHLMVQVMESWFLADVDALQSHYGHGFRQQSLPQNPDIEKVAKDDVLSGLDQAAKATNKGAYKKGRDSFPILEKLDPAKVRIASPYADRFIEALLKLGTA